MVHRDKRGQSKTTRIFENSGTSGATAGPASKQSCSKTTLILFAMAKDHKRPACYRYSSRVQNRFSHNTLAKTCSKDDSCWEKFPLNATRDNQTCRKGGYNPRTSHAHGVLQSSISSTKERRLISPSHRLKSLEQIHSERTFPNGKLNVHKAPLKRKRIYGQTRPKRDLESQKFLRFVWLGQTYQFLALPFGLNTAPRIFTKLLKPVVAYLHTRNIRLLIYLDDILIIGSSVQILREHTVLVIELLRNLGFIINYEKSLLTPTPVLEFLGFLINSKTMKFYLPQTKVAKVLDLCKSLLKENPISLHLLAQLQGFLESCRPAVWLAPLHFRHLQSCLIQQVALNKGSYQGTVLLDPQAREELQWWITNIKRVNGSPIRPPAPEMVITSDASKMGWGATFGNLSTNGRWSKQESDLHINVLELKATFLAIQAFLKNQSNLAVKLRLDNTTAVTYVNNQGGTRSPSLTLLTLCGTGAYNATF